MKQNRSGHLAGCGDVDGILQDNELLGSPGQVPAAALLQDDHVLDADAQLAGQVDAAWEALGDSWISTPTPWPKLWVKA